MFISELINEHTSNYEMERQPNTIQEFKKNIEKVLLHLLLNLDKLQKLIITK